MMSVMTSATGKVVGLYIGAEKGAGKTAVESAELVADYGIRGDSHAGSDDRQISLFESEVLSQLQAEGLDVSAEGISANLFTEGIALSSLEPGARLRVDEAIIEISEVRKPCGSLTKLDQRLPKRLYQRCGLLGRIIKGGMVSTGATIELLATHSRQGKRWQ